MKSFEIVQVSLKSATVGMFAHRNVIYSERLKLTHLKGFHRYHYLKWVAQTLCDPMAYTVHGIFQARILEWVAMPSSRGSSQPRDQTQVSRIAGRFLTSWDTREVHYLRMKIKQVCVFFFFFSNLSISRKTFNKYTHQHSWLQATETKVG